jgi:hypothetical protein
MSHRALPFVTFGLVLAGVAVYVLATAAELPPQVATHFGRGGAPDGWMTRHGYVVYMLAFAVGFPVLVTGAIALAPRLAPRWTSLPNRDYWLAPARRSELLEFLAGHACWLGCAMSLTAGAVHGLLLRAARLDPPRLETGLFLATLGLSLAACAWWGIALYRRLRIPPRGAR